MDKKKIFAIALFFIMGFFMFTFANPSEETEKLGNENIDVEEKEDDNTASLEDAINNQDNNQVVNAIQPVIQQPVQAVQQPAIVVNAPADTVAPVITLNGEDVIIRVNDEYVELGATATDNVDGDLTSSIVISGDVDTTKKGEYVLTYDVADKSGNNADSVTRKVTVVDVTELVNIITEANKILDNDNKSTNKELNDLLDELEKEKNNGDAIVEDETSLQDEVDNKTEEINEIIEKIKNLEFTVKFVDFDDSEISTETVKYYESATLPSTPSRDGYKFLKWNGKYTNVVDNETVKASYETIPYSISYNLNGGSLQKENQTTYTIEDSITLNNPTKQGYDFEGWYIDSKKVTKIENMMGDLELVANYTESTNTAYKITIKEQNLDKTYNVSSKTYYDRTNKEVSYTTSKDGFKINASSVTSGTIAADGSLELIIIYDRNSYNLTVDGVSTSKLYGEQVSLSDSTLTGYDFKGYRVSSPETLTTIPTTMPNYDVTIVSLWDAHTYQITYNNVNGATNNNRTSYTVNSPAIFTDLERLGYDFNGFTYKGVAITRTNGYTEDLSLFANWTVTEYTLTFDSNGGNSIDDINYTILDPVTLPTPEKAGYTFTGWYDENTKVESVITGDYDLVAHYTINPYTITYVDELNATNSNRTSYNVENNVTISDLAKTGYTFNGWYDGETKVTSTSGYAKDLTLTASWTIIPYNITYDLNGGSLSRGVTNPTTYNVNSDITLNNPSKENYTFVGWYNGEVEVTRIYEMTGDLELTAVYAPVQTGISAEYKDNSFLQFTKNTSVDVKDYINVYPVYADGTKGDALDKDEYTVEGFSTSDVVSDKTLTVKEGTFTDTLTYSIITEKSFQSKFEVIYQAASYQESKKECTGFNEWGEFTGYCDESGTITKNVNKPILEVIEHYDQYITVNSVTANYSNKNSIVLDILKEKNKDKNENKDVRWSHKTGDYINDLISVHNPVYITSVGKLNKPNMQDVDINHITTVDINYTRTFGEWVGYGWSRYYHKYYKTYVVTFENRDGIFVAIDEYEIKE